MKKTFFCLCLVLSASFPGFGNSIYLGEFGKAGESGEFAESEKIVAAEEIVEAGKSPAPGESGESTSLKKEIQFNLDNRNIDINYSLIKVDTGPQTKYGYLILAKNIVVTITSSESQSLPLFLEISHKITKSYSDDIVQYSFSKSATRTEKVIRFSIPEQIVKEVGYPGEVFHNFELKIKVGEKLNLFPLDFNK